MYFDGVKSGLWVLRGRAFGFTQGMAAARHVANILSKLGFRSRTQIAAWMADRPSQANGPT